MTLDTSDKYWSFFNCSMAINYLYFNITARVSSSSGSCEGPRAVFGPLTSRPRKQLHAGNTKKLRVSS